MFDVTRRKTELEVTQVNLYIILHILSVRFICDLIILDSQKELLQILVIWGNNKLVEWNETKLTILLVMTSILDIKNISQK